MRQICYKQAAKSQQPCGKFAVNTWKSPNKFAEMSRQLCGECMKIVQEIQGKARGKVLANKQQQLRQYCSKCLEMIAVKW
jgi:ribosomal protein S27AE